MYIPAHFREDREHVLFEFIRAHSLGVLVAFGSEGPEASHVPFYLDTSQEQARLRCHVARANLILADLPRSAVLAIFSGAEHYVSPSWYPSKVEHGRVVPTWNYAAVHVRGRARMFEEREELLAHLRELTAFNEADLPEPWRPENAPEAYITGLMSGIVGVEIVADRIEGKWKMSQNRTLADRLGVVDALERAGTPRSLAVAEMVKERS